LWPDQSESTIDKYHPAKRNRSKEYLDKIRRNVVFKEASQITGLEKSLANSQGKGRVAPAV
jgi:hypothetical protein